MTTGAEAPGAATGLRRRVRDEMQAHAWLLGLCALAAAAALGAATALSPLLAVIATGGVVLAAVASRDLSLALVIWIPTLFLEALPAFNAAGKGGGLVILGAWVLQQRREFPGVRALLGGSPAILALLLVLLTWTTLTAVWAPDWRHALGQLLRWYAVAVLFVVVATTVRELVTVRLVAMAFLAGGVLSVVVSLHHGTPIAEGSVGDARLGSAAGDPNFLGAWLLSSLLLALGILACRTNIALRVVLVATLPLLAVGMALTLSRGAFVSAVITAVAALLLLRGRRVQVLWLTLVSTAGLTAWLSTSADAWARFTRSDGGSGRYDLWQVAWKMARQNPMTGVGLDNFTVTADVYMRQAGPLPASYLIARPQPDEVHNVYLQILAEGGPLALVLLVGFLGVCLTATVRAARRLDAVGRRAGSSLAYGVLLAQVSLLAAGVFLSSVVDKRIWLLLAMGPALAAVSRVPPGRLR